MKNLILYAATILPSLVVSIDYQSAGGFNGFSEPHFKVEPNHYLDFPVIKKDFQFWHTAGCAVILRNKTVIVPESRDKKGMVYNSQPNPNKRDWMLDVEVQIGNDKKSSRGGTGLGIYYLKQIDQASHMESSFGYSNRYEGLGIYLNTLIKSERGSQNEITNAVQGFYNDGNKILNIYKEKGHMCFKKFRNLPADQYQRIRIQYDSPLVTVQLYDIFSETFEFCFSFEANLDFNGYFLLSAGSGSYNPDHVYLHSFKLYDPKSVATNDHFQEARRTKATRDDISNKIRDGVKDLFEKHSQIDTGAYNKTKGDRDVKNLVELIPSQRHHLNHRLDQIYTLMEEDDKRFFEHLRGIPSHKSYGEMSETFFNFRLKVDNLNKQLDENMNQLREFDQKIKQVRYTAGNLQRGVQQREVSNPSTKALSRDLSDIDVKLLEISLLLNDYNKAIDTLGDKIKRESGFAQKLEDERRKFAQEQSSQMRYEMSEIDQVFNEMERQVIKSGGGGWSAMIINIGMVAVIIVSGALWVKMQRYEHKNT